MTSLEFNLFNLEKKESLVKNFGHLVNKKYLKSNLRICVYSFADFYVQVAEKFNNQIQFIKAIEIESVEDAEIDLYKVYMN